MPPLKDVVQSIVGAMVVASNSLMKAYEQALNQPISQAQGLPFAVYQDEAIHELEMDKAFMADWVFVCAASQLPNAGDYFAFTLGQEPLVVIHGQDGELRALSNVCRHRGTPILDEGFGSLSDNKGRLSCPYHAWTYQDDGQLLAAPFASGQGGSIKLDKSAHCLPRFHLGQVLGLLFINVSAQAVAIEQRFAELESFTSVYEPHRFTHGYVGQVEVWDCNWKLAMENAMESYHLFSVHADTLEKNAPTKLSFHVAGGSEWSLSAGKFEPAPSGLSKWLRGKYPKAYDHYLLMSLAPNFVGIMTYESFDWVQVLPLGAKQCRIISGGMSSEKNAKYMQHKQDRSEAFLAEDKWICERAMKGMGARYSQGGKLVSMEKILVEFRQYLASRLFNAAQSNLLVSEQANLFLMGES